VVSGVAVTSGLGLLVPSVPFPAGAPPHAVAIHATAATTYFMRVIIGSSFGLLGILWLGKQAGGTCAILALLRKFPWLVISHVFERTIKEDTPI
jgi:hypothetical protein